ncbi:auxin Efflux Carrier domain protein [Clostridioides difficile P74]|nr:auxin Efflux Carrier domain protein [Clostridioides difficile CD175]EQK28769.1 auxin Efflux Carrier domain protein [Clostridioides difficile P74]
MSGFVKTLLIICFILTLPPLKISSITTDNTLNIGTITAINKDVTPILLSPNSEIVTGIPNITKLLRNTPCINAPLVLLSFSILGIIKTKIKKIEKIIITATAISLKLREPSKSVLYILKNNNNGKKDLKQTLFILFKV